MACVCVWFLSALLSVLIIQGKPDVQKLTAPEELKVYPDEDPEDLGVWKMNIEWRDGFPNSITPETVTYDIQIFYTEQKKLVLNETIKLKADPMGHYKWSWTSPLPLQCTSHSVKLRYRDGDRTSAWTPPTTLPGKDLPDVKLALVYPQDHVALVNESIRFCCILKPDHKENFNSTDFIIQISNQTYATNPKRYPDPSPTDGFDIVCKDQGSTYFVGYPPDVRNITCETRDLSSVECHWIVPTTVPKATEFYVNGRMCDREVCVFNNYIDTGIINWTLTASNRFGTTIIFDCTDPRHRVHLKAPTLLNATLITERNATLDWKWSRLTNYSSFPMVCQVEVNGIIIKETFEGKELISLVLPDLKPYKEYKVRLQCGSSENFYKWGDWSDLISFITKEDIPDSVDVWIDVSGNQTYVVWKNEHESNGKITNYELVFESLTGPNTERIIKSPVERCHKLQADLEETHHLISVFARNSVGLSQPSSITIPNLPPGGVNTGVINGINKTFYMTWDSSPWSKCGYVVDWYPTYKPHRCAVKWKKISSYHFNATIDSDLKEGVKYTVSVFGCTSEALSLLQRKEGYAVELPPSGKVQNLKAKQGGLNVYLSWENVSEQEQNGFIKGYNVSFRSAGGDEENVVISDSSAHMYKFRLPVETYTFTIKAFTSAGDGPGAELTLKMDHQYGLTIITMVAGLTVLGFVLCMIAVFCNWKWLKSTLWPEIPKPRLSAEFFKKSVHQWQVMDRLLNEEAVLKVNCPALEEICHKAPAYNHPQSKVLLLCSEEYQTPKINPPAVGHIDVDFSYQEFPCPGILNPTYDQSLVSATENRIVSNYRPQQPSDISKT